MYTFMLTFLAILPLFGVEAQLQTCLNGGSGPCLNGACPNATLRCINTTAGQVCCDINQISNVSATTAPLPTTTVRTTTAVACLDRVNPRTGVSDCPGLSRLCNDPVYFAVMTAQCPRTCGRCGTNTTASPACRDLVNPRTGVSDCPGLSRLCNEPLYNAVMTTQCPRTCGRCGGTNTTTPAACEDMVNPATRTSDCPARMNLCRDPNYVSLMRQQCRKTCQYC